MTENENEAVDPEVESDEVDVEPYEGEPDKLVPPSHQHTGLEEVQDDEPEVDTPESLGTIDPRDEGEGVGDDLAEAEPLSEPPRLQNFGDADA